MQLININYPKIKSSLENIYLTTKEASSVLGCSREKVLFYTKAPKDVIRRKGEGKVLVNAYDVYNAVSVDNSDRLKFLAKAKNYLFQISDYVYNEVASEIYDREGKVNWEHEIKIGKDLIQIEIFGKYETEVVHENDYHNGTGASYCSWVEISFECKTFLYDESDDDWIEVANTFNEKELKTIICKN